MTERIIISELHGKTKVAKKIPNLQNYLERLKNNDPSLTEINLSSSRISEEMAKELAEAIAVNKTVTSLNLGRKYIGDIGLKHLANALREK